jgi:class 3 adenylate cyclase/pimeloyl-ACP methyl ester carboxylesterase
VADSRIRFVRNGPARMAYREFGDGENVLVYVPGWAHNVGWYDESGNPFASFMDAISRQMRVVVFDRRGTGMSDPVLEESTLQERADDLLAVIDAAKIEFPALMGIGDSGPTCIQFAVTYPERVHSMVLYGTAATFTPHQPDFPWGFTAEEMADLVERQDAEWGEGLMADLFFGEAADIPGVRELLGRLERTTGSPTTARTVLREFATVDVRTLLGAVRVPTLVMSRPGDRLVAFEAAAALAAGIPGAKFRPLPPGSHASFDIIDVLVAEIAGFVRGEPSESANERVLQTILFTDIVGSTESLSAQGDAHWRHQLNLHDEAVDTALAKYGGRRAKHTGDGIFALFDGPSNTVRCALELVGALAARGIRIRAGIHVGECERRGDEWSGMAVHVGARIAGLAGAGQVLTSRTVRDLCAGSDLVFEDLGPCHLKGVPEDASIYLAKASAAQR